MKRSRDAAEIDDNIVSKKLVKFKKEKEIYLPIEILEEIINKLTIWDLGRVRAACVQFRNAVDNILIRRLMHNIRIFDELPLKMECVCSKIFYQLSWPYIRYGYRSTVAGVYLYVINSIIYSNSSEIFPPFLSSYIVQFYQCIDCPLGNPQTQLSRLLYVVTILGFLSNLPNIDRKEQQINSTKLKLKFIMNGTMFGLLWSPTQRNALVYPGDRDSVIIFLADIMVSNIIDTPVYKIWENEGSGRVVVYGNKYSNSKDKIKLGLVLLEITINGSNTLLEFLRTAPGAGDWKDLPTDNFTVILKITCKEAQKLGCPANYSFKI